MKNTIDLNKMKQREVYMLSDKFKGTSKDGHTLGFTNHYMYLDGKPFVAVSGECHFTRVAENQWEDTILMMKAGGINVVATYLFWNHHEEEEGIFRFDGRRNLRKFVEICAKHGLYVILRVGPFDHGEVRNGGLPDWLYGKDFDSRCSSEGFLECTRKLFREVAKQVEGLFYKDGGPIIGAQMDNEYMHSAAPWEIMAGSTDEWITKGDEGDAYLLKLKQIAQEEGIITPFYTCTGWGGAATPTEELMPLWGGYSCWPWIYLNYEGPHPVTPEYIFRDYHNNDVPATYNFEPFYEPESMPYACCEMGGGMSVFYMHRFKFPFESVDAMANIKLGSGCNFLGYYMYRGGSNPRGKVNEFLNEGQCSKITYDYQAPIGEFGQIRPTFHRLRALHLFTKNFGQAFCDTFTALPENSQMIEPEDQKPLRYAVRTDGQKGFVFVNNYQDHIELEKKVDEEIELTLTNGQVLSFEHISLDEGESVALPFNLELKEGVKLVQAAAQPISVIEEEEGCTYFFYAPNGMMPYYVFDGATIQEENARVENCVPGESIFTVTAVNGKKLRFVTLTRAQSLNFYEVEWQGKMYAVLYNRPLAVKDTCIEVMIGVDDQEEAEGYFVSYPAMESPLVFGQAEEKEEGIFTGYTLQLPKAEVLPVANEVCGKYRYRLHIPAIPENWKDAILQIDYAGNVGQAFIQSQMVSDNYANDTTWEIGLREIESSIDLTKENTMVVRISPNKIGASVDASSVMAGRTEVVEKEIAQLYRLAVKGTCDVRLF